MKTHLKEYARKAQLLGILIFATVPLPIMLAGEKAPLLSGWVWVYPLVYFLAAMICFGIPGKWRLGAGIGISVVILTAAGLFCPPGCMVVSLLSALLYCALLLWSLRVAAWSSGEEIPGFWVVAGSVVHIAALIVLFSDGKEDAPELLTARPWIHLSLYLFILFTMFSMNRRSLVAASGKRQRASRTMRWQNTLLTAALFCACTAAALLPSVLKWIKAALSQLWKWISALLQRFAREDVTGEIVGNPGEGGPMFMEQAGEASAMARFLEIIVLGIGMLLFLAIAGFLLYRLGRMLWRLLRKLMVLWSRFAASSTEDYEDEITNTREASTEYKKLSRKKTGRLLRKEYLALSPQRRIRYTYFQLSRRNPQWGSTSTARENLPSQPAALYERSRYSNHSVTAEEAEAFVNLTRNM